MTSSDCSAGGSTPLQTFPGPLASRTCRLSRQSGARKRTGPTVQRHLSKPEGSVSGQGRALHLVLVLQEGRRVGGTRSASSQG
jgi:hypothetical protein